MASDVVPEGALSKIIFLQSCKALKLGESCRHVLSVCKKSFPSSTPVSFRLECSSLMSALISSFKTVHWDPCDPNGSDDSGGEYLKSSKYSLEYPE